MNYDISLSISYHYQNPADGGRHVLRMMPKDIEGIQRVVAASQSFSPEPVEQLSRTDFFGNRFVEVGFGGSQSEMVFEVRARVERLLLSPPACSSVNLTALAEELEHLRSLDCESPHNFLAPSSRIELHTEMTAYAQKHIAANSTVMQLVESLGLALHQDIRFDPEATNVNTPPLEAFRQRHGVCQDISHIMIAALRGLRIPAGYVSGFLRTIPPPGEAPLEGADAMHAWVQVWCGSECGWVEYDPTNGMFVAADHIVIAKGRDYSDVSPVKGLTRSAGDHVSKQRVTVKPLL